MALRALLGRRLAVAVAPRGRLRAAAVRLRGRAARGRAHLARPAGRPRRPGSCCSALWPGDFDYGLRHGGPAAATWIALFGGALALGAAMLLRPAEPRPRSALGAGAAVLFTLPVLIHGLAHWSPRVPVRSAGALAPARAQPADEGAEGRDRDRPGAGELPRRRRRARSTSSRCRSRTSPTRARTTRTDGVLRCCAGCGRTTRASPAATERPGRSVPVVSIVSRDDEAQRQCPGARHLRAVAAGRADRRRDPVSGRGRAGRARRLGPPARAGFSGVPLQPAARATPTATTRPSRELLETWRREGKIVLPVALLAARGVRRGLAASPARSRLRSVRFASSRAAGRSVAVAAVLAHEIRYTGAGTIGWPLIWSVPLLPYRALGLPLDPSIAFGVGLTLSLVFIAATVVATYLLGRAVTGRLWIGVAASLLYAFWPAARPAARGDPRHDERHLADRRRAEHVHRADLDVRSRASALVLVVRAAPARFPPRSRAPCLGFDVAVRLSNALILGVVLVWLLRSRSRPGAAGRPPPPPPSPRSCSPSGARATSTRAPTRRAPDPAARASSRAHTFALHNARLAWSHSLLWRPPAAPRARAARRRRARSPSRAPSRCCLAAAILATAAFYTFYFATPIHPRFLFVVLPLVLVLWAAGVCAVVGKAPSAAGHA